MKKTIQQLYYAVSYMGIDTSVNEAKERDFIILINQYIFLLSLLFFLQDVFTLLFIGFVWTSLLLIVICIFFVLALALPKRFIKNNIVISTTIIALTLVVTYYSSHCGFGSGIFLFYFPLATAVFVFFSWHIDRYIIIFLLSLILSTLYLSAYHNFELFENNKDYIHFRHILLMLNISCMLLVSGLNSYFFHQKIEGYYFVLNRNLYKREQIENLSSEVLRLKKMMNRDLFSEKTLKELIESIQLNDTIFLEKFEIYFSGFFKNLQNQTTCQLYVSDLKMCAMLKLGFTAKQIAIYTNSSIKSVESKIYRLRKKLNISTDIDSKSWFTDL